MLDSVGIAGFWLLLLAWLGMFMRVRRDLPGHPMARYTSHNRLLRPLALGAGGGLLLIPFYYRRYGVDGWVILAATAGLLMTVALIWDLLT